MQKLKTKDHEIMSKKRGALAVDRTNKYGKKDGGREGGTEGNNKVEEKGTTLKVNRG